MPLPVDNLNKKSTNDAVKKAIGRSISQLIHEGRSQKQASAIAYSVAEKKTGKNL